MSPFLESFLECPLFCSSLFCSFSVPFLFPSVPGFDNFNLQDDHFGFGPHGEDHSGQFTSNIAKRWEFWRHLVNTADLEKVSNE